MILGAKKLKRTLRQAPGKIQNEARKAVRKSTVEGVNLARTLAPNVTGKTRDMIEAKYSADRLVGSVEAAPAEKEAQKKTRAIEFGRKRGAGGKERTNRKDVPEQPYIRPTENYLEARHKRRVARGIRKGIKDASGG